MSELVERIRDYVYRDALTGTAAVALQWAAVRNEDQAAQLYLQDVIFAQMWQPFERKRLEASLWCAAQELIAQTTRCRARRITPEICKVAARIVAEQVKKRNDEYWNLSIQEGVPKGRAYSGYGPGQSDHLQCTIIRIGELWSFQSKATRTIAPTSRWSPISLTSRCETGDRFAGAWLLTGELAE